jgi:glycosyltransferase involved in cell wall biosynthesis
MKRNLLYIGNKLSKKGNTVTSIETLGNYLQEEGFKVLTASSMQNKALRLLDMISAVVRMPKRNASVIIDTYSTQNFYYAVFVAWVCRFRRIPYIPILRGGNLPTRLQKSPKKSKALFEGAHINVAPSHYLMNAFQEQGYTNLIHIPNTLQLENYPFLLRKELQPKLLWVRSFSKIYNPQLALAVLELLLQKGYDATLTMVGPPKDESFAKCKARAKEQKLPVTFTGILTKEAWISLAPAHDIFINTTNFDNTPVSVMEAMALGLPVVSTNVGGLPFLIEDSVDGLLVSKENPAAFVEALVKLINNPRKAETIGVNARKKVAKFDWQVVKQQWISLLSQ